MTRIAILTAGSRGDVQPYVALGSGLRQAGFEVRVATHSGFREVVEAHGLEFAPVAHPSDALSADPRWQALQRAGDTAGRFVSRWARLARIVQPLLAQMVADHRAACQGADAVLSNVAAAGGPQHAAALGIPHWWALVQPMSPTREYPHFMAPDGVRLPGWLNARSHVLAERVHWRMFRRAVRRSSAASGRANGTARPRPGALFGAGGGPIVYGMSPSVVPRPRDWPANIVQFGHWFLDSPSEEALPPEVTAFLEAGSPPVFVHAARIAGAPREEFVATAVRIVRRLGFRCLVSGASAAVEPPESVMAVPMLPFDRLFPRVAGVVHHGGVGTTATALRAGVPSLGVPGFLDQKFWTSRVAALGAGPRPVPARRATEARLAPALAQLVGDTSIRDRAAALGRRIRSERGVEETVAYLRTALETRGGPNGA